MCLMIWVVSGPGACLGSSPGVPGSLRGLGCSLINEWKPMLVDDLGGFWALELVWAPAPVPLARFGGLDFFIEERMEPNVF